MGIRGQDLPRIFFDPNEGPDDIRYALWLPQSMNDLDALGGDIRDGIRVVIYSVDGVEMQATLEFDRCCDGWTARPVETVVCQEADRSREMSGAGGR